MKPEYMSLIVNVVSLAYYIWKGDQPGKLIYWLGACLLTIGLLKMRG